MELFFDAFRRSNPETQLPESVTVVSNLRLDLSKVTFRKSNLRTELSKITVHVSNVRLEKRLDLKSDTLHLSSQPDSAGVIIEMSK